MSAIIVGKGMGIRKEIMTTITSTPDRRDPQFGRARALDGGMCTRCDGRGDLRGGTP
jgi:hypothetical protein